MDAGQGNRVYQNITNSTITDNSKTYNIGNIETAQFVYQSLDYQALMERIAEKQEMVQYLQETGQTERALKAAAELEELEKQREQFKENVFRLYETFTRIEINTERLAQAKAHFDRGEFREADAILNAADMARDLTQLIERDQQLDREKAEIEQHRTQLANEYLIKAQLRAINFEEPNRFEQSCDYFEEALRAARTPEIAFAHAKFLQEHYCFDRAKPLYQEVLQIFQDLAKENPGIFLPNVAMTLNNLAILQADQNDFSGAEQNYQEALQIYRDLAKENPRTFLPDVATTLNNLANLQADQNDFSGAEQNYQEALQIYRDLAKENPRTFLPAVATTLNNLANLQADQNDFSGAEQNYQEALQIRRDLAKENPRTFLPDVAMTLNNLAILQKAQNDFSGAEQNYQEALQIRRDLAKENPRTFLPAVATTLNNLANLQADQNDFSGAEQNYQEALQIYRDLAKENPRTFLPNVAATLLNLSIFYLQAHPDRERSLSLATEVLEIAQQFPQVPAVQNYAALAIRVLEASGVDPETYIAERLNRSEPS
jgi:tetratricopeptide (TPR) repeat protein